MEKYDGRLSPQALLVAGVSMAFAEKLVTWAAITDKVAGEANPLVNALMASYGLVAGLCIAFLIQTAGYLILTQKPTKVGVWVVLVSIGFSAVVFAYNTLLFAEAL